MALNLPAGFSLTYLGHSTVIFETPTGARVLVDPFVSSNPKSPIKNEEVGKIDLILVTHGHADHFADTIPLLKATGCRVLTNPEIATYLQFTTGIPGNQVIEAQKGGTVVFSELGCSITLTHADHSSNIDNENGTLIYGGEPLGFMVTLHGDEPYTFYLAGDTAVFGDMRLLAEIYQPRLALLPIGDHFTMGPREAAVASTLLASVEWVIPIHWGTFPLLTGTPEKYQDALTNVEATVQVYPMLPGDVVSG